MPRRKAPTENELAKLVALHYLALYHPHIHHQLVGSGFGKKIGVAPDKPTPPLTPDTSSFAPIARDIISQYITSIGFPVSNIQRQSIIDVLLPEMMEENGYIERFGRSQRGIHPIHIDFNVFNHWFSTNGREGFLNRIRALIGRR